MEDPSVYSGLRCFDDPLRPREPNFLKGNNSRDYTTAVDRIALTAATNTLRIVPDDRNSEEQFAVARELITRAANICFLGFGYDPVNLNRIGMDEQLRRKDHHQGWYRHGKGIFGTTLGLKKAEIASAVLACAGDAVRFADSSCEDMLRTYGILS
jgi:hypothetical protein